MSRKALREKRLRERRRRRLMTALIITGAALILAALLIYPSLKPVGDIVQITPIDRHQVEFNTMGDPNAPVVIEEYSDFQCPACRMFFERTEKQLIETYIATGKVYFIYHSMGAFIGPESLAAAEAAYCAGDQGRFWDYHDMLFVNQTGENVGAFSTKRLTAFAETLGLDMKAFNQCFKGHKYRQLATQDQVDGRNKGVRATPTFLVNGQLVQGAQPFETMRQIIEAELAKIE